MSIYEVVKRKTQKERIKELEEENARLGEAFETELWDKTTYLDLSEEQQKRIKELEEELLELKLSGGREHDVAVIATKQLSAACARHRAASKWAKRWKRATIARENKICELNLTQAVFSIALLKRDERIAALENAARSCATCLYYVPDHLEPIPDYCNTNCRKPDIRNAGWVFNEKRFAPKGEGTR